VIMKKSLEMLKKLKKSELEKAKQTRKCPKEVYSFLNQLKEDFKLVIPPSPDPIKQAENELNALFKVAKTDFTAFSHESLDKLLLVYDVLPAALQQGQDGYLVNEFYSGVDTVVNKGIGGMEKKLISQHMDNIISALKKNNTKAVIQACTELGIFFQDNFPGKRLNEIQKYLREFRDYESKELPPLDIIGVLSEAKIRVYEQVAEQQGNQKNILAMDALSKGIALFGTLMGGERVDPELGKLDVTEDAISNAEKLVHDSLPSNVEKRSKASNIIKIMEKDCVECETHLRAVISQEASKLPSSGSQYYKVEDSSIKMGEIDVDKLSDDLTNKTGSFSDSTYYQSASRELVVAVQSYQATKKLHDALKSDESNPIKKLENVRDEYNKKETKDAIKSNPDSKVVRFFKKAGYYLANFFTAGLVHALTEGSPIMSPQQKLGKRTREALEVASKEQIINKGPTLRSLR